MTTEELYADKKIRFDGPDCKSFCYYLLRRDSDPLNPEYLCKLYWTSLVGGLNLDKELYAYRCLECQQDNNSKTNLHEEQLKQEVIQAIKSFALTNEGKAYLLSNLSEEHIKVLFKL
jgi:hypothetical protein